MIGHTFECKAWLIEALTHKSHPKENQNTQLDDYERLEFLGDAVLGYLMAKYFFIQTQNDEKRKNPKELHKMKTSVINNNLLSLIIIENGIDKYIIYNKRAQAFKEQYDRYVATVHNMIKTNGSTKDIAAKKMAQKPDSFDKENESMQSVSIDQSFESSFSMPSHMRLEPTKAKSQVLLKEFDLDDLHE